MYRGALPIDKSRKSKKRAMTEAEYIEDDSEQAAKDAKMSKATTCQQNLMLLMCFLFSKKHKS